jgi:hypothetical protein
MEIDMTDSILRDRIIQYCVDASEFINSEYSDPVADADILLHYLHPTSKIRDIFPKRYDDLAAELLNGKVINVKDTELLADIILNLLEEDLLNKN